MLSTKQLVYIQQRKYATDKNVIKASLKMLYGEIDDRKRDGSTLVLPELNRIRKDLEDRLEEIKRREKVLAS